MRSAPHTRTLAGLAALTLLVAAAATILSATASATAASPPAAGPVVTYEVERGSTEHTTTAGPPFKEVTAYCRGGRKLIGVAYSHSGGSGVVIDEAVPVVDQPGHDDKVTVRAYETPAGTPSAWHVEVRAICASELAGVRLVTVPSAIDTARSKTVVAECPTGTNVVGTSFAAFSAGAPGQVIVTAVNPAVGGSGGRDTVSVIAHADDGSTGIWGVTAYAFCATPPPGLEIRSDLDNPADLSRESATAHAECPAGTLGLGVGWSFSNVAGVAEGTVMPVDLYVGGPYTQFRGAPYVATARGTEDADGTSAGWALTVKIICGGI